MLATCDRYNPAARIRKNAGRFIFMRNYRRCRYGSGVMPNELIDALASGVLLAREDTSGMVSDSYHTAT
jgi:hypothetical protein